MIYSFLCMAENIVQVQHDVVLKNLFYVLSKNSPIICLYFDDWFSTLPLLIKSYSFSILPTSTFRSNRIGLYPLMTDKDLKSEDMEALIVEQM